jgi:hypothetical protein
MDNPELCTDNHAETCGHPWPVVRSECKEVKNGDEEKQSVPSCEMQNKAPQHC